MYNYLPIYFTRVIFILNIRVFYVEGDKRCSISNYT